MSVKTTTMTAKVKVPAPFEASDLKEFLRDVPAEAKVSVTVVEGGSQREPYPVEYRLVATWEAFR